MPLSVAADSGSFEAVEDLLHVLGAEKRPEYRFLGFYVPWILVVTVAGFVAAWLVIAILERTGASRHIWHLPLFFLALLVLFTSILGFVFFP